MMGLGKCILFFKYGIILGIYVKFRGVSNIRKCNLFGALPLPITVEMKVNWNENCDDRGGECTWERGHPNT